MGMHKYRDAMNLLGCMNAMISRYKVSNKIVMLLCIVHKTDHSKRLLNAAWLQTRRLSASNNTTKH